MCLEFKDFVEATKNPVEPVIGYRLWRMSDTNRDAHGGYIVSSYWMGTHAYLKEDDYIDSDRHSAELDKYEIAEKAVSRGLHVFVGDNAKRAVLNVAKQGYGDLITAEVEGTPDDFVARGTWDGFSIICAVFTKIKIKKFICTVRDRHNRANISREVEYFHGVEPINTPAIDID